MHLKLRELSPFLSSITSQFLDFIHCMVFYFIYPLISFKRDKNIGSFSVRSAFQTSDQSGTFNFARARCKTCPFVHNVEKISVPIF